MILWKSSEILAKFREWDKFIDVVDRQGDPKYMYREADAMYHDINDKGVIELGDGAKYEADTLAKKLLVFVEALKVWARGSKKVLDYGRETLLNYLIPAWEELEAMEELKLPGLKVGRRAIIARINSLLAQDLGEKVTEFLKANPNPSDDDLHAWAEGEGLEVDEVEEEAYKLATKFVNFMSGGKAAEAGITEEDVDPEELKRGIAVEMEHTDDEGIARKVALDHISEFSDYYSALDEMEKKLKEKK